MAIKIIPEKSKLGNLRATIVVEAPTRDEVVSAATRDFILAQARSQGFPAAGVGGLPLVYPVDAAGETPSELLAGKQKIAGYRGDYILYAKP